MHVESFQESPVEDKTERAQLARELIALAAKHWEDTPESSITIEEDGRIIFVFVFRSENGTSTIRFDPQPSAEKIIEDLERLFAGTENKSSKGLRLSKVHANAMGAITSLQSIARKMFEDCLRELPLAAYTTYHAVVLKALGGKEQRHSEIDEALAAFTNRKKQRFGRFDPSRRPKGSVEPESKREQKRAEFRSKVKEEMIRFIGSGKEFNKTEIARVVGCGGKNQKTKRDTSLQTFSTKLRRLNLDYEEILKEAEEEVGN